MSKQPDLSFWKLWNISFGFFGVQIAYALQSSQVSRIFATIGADPHDLSYFWILPPLMGLIVQPIVGIFSDKTWCRMGRRLPYLVAGALVAIIVMCLLPNAGSFHFTVQLAIIFGLIMLMFLDTSINMAMQPFKMLVGDFVNEKQKAKAYSIQSFLCNAGSLVGYIAPIVLAMFLANTAPEGEVPPTVTWSFYIGAAIMALCVIYTLAKVKEMPPAEYAAYHGIDPAAKKAGKKGSENVLRLLAKAPKVFWTVGLVQFFCWAAFLFMWTYSTDAIANHVFKAPAVERVTGVTVNGKSYPAKHLFADKIPVIDNGHLTLGGVRVDGTLMHPQTVVADGDTVISNGVIATVNGRDKVRTDNGLIASASQTVYIDGAAVNVNESVVTVSQLDLVAPGTTYTIANIATRDNTSGEYILDETSELPTSADDEIVVSYSTVLNPASSEYQAAGNWNGVMYAIQAIAAVLWAVVLAQFRRRKLAYSLSLAIGAVGFVSVMWFSNQYVLGVSFALMGCAWAAMLAMPFTILTNALNGNHIGTYLGLFNCTICIPQIVAALLGGLVLGLFPAAENGAPNTVWMMVSAGVLLLLGAAAVWIIRETFGSKEATA